MTPLVLCAQANLAAGQWGGFKNRDFVAPLSGNPGGFQPAGTCTDDDYFLTTSAGSMSWGIVSSRPVAAL